MAQQGEGKSAVAAHQVDTGVQGVACDLCIGRKRKASKSCMRCQVSYCEDHLQPHYGVPVLKKHKLMEPIENLQENICSEHEEIETSFCRECKKCICDLCKKKDHASHKTVPAEKEKSKRQKELQTGQCSTQNRAQVLQKNIDQLKQELKAINESADKVNKTISSAFALIRKKRVHLTERIKQQQTLEVTRVQKVLEALQRELTVERERDTELKQVAAIKNNSEFLQRCSSVSAKWKNHNPCNTFVIPDHPSPLKYFEQVSSGMSDLKQTCVKSFEKLAQMTKEVDVLLPQIPKSNEEFLHYSHQVILDQNTANNALELSEKNTKVSCVRDNLPHPPHSDRFMEKKQVLSKDALPPRCYWEVEWTGLSVYIGVAYRDIKRDGNDCIFGKNGQSWVLKCEKNKAYSYKHNGESTVLSLCESCRVGVFLDHTAGTLCFYQFSQTTKLIHVVQTRFTQPLYVGLGVEYFGATAKMCIRKTRLRAACSQSHQTQQLSLTNNPS